MTNAEPGSFRVDVGRRRVSVVAVSVVVLSQNHHPLPLEELNKGGNKKNEETKKEMRNTLDTIPHELLEKIALFTVTSDPLGPPHELVPLLLVNRRLHATLASASNPHLHARIFAAKFDTAALVRRLGPDASARTTSTGTGAGGATSATKLAAELRRRCVQLKRLKAGVGYTIGAFAALAGGSGAGGGLTEEGMRALHEMLWTAYLMMLENDGKNERQLREYARLDRWLRKFWFAEDGASCAQIAIRDNAWPPNNDLSALTMWLFWFLLRPGALRCVLSLVPPSPSLGSFFSTNQANLLVCNTHTPTNLTLSATHHLRSRTNLPSPLLFRPPFFFLLRVVPFHVLTARSPHITYMRITTRGILRAERRRVSGRNFHIEAAGPRGTSGMSSLRVSSFAYDVLFSLDPFLPSSLCDLFLFPS